MKIAISGAGIGGPTLAYWLLRSGHQVTLIESASRPRQAGYMIDLWGSGYAVAERMGLLPSLRAAGYEIEEVRYVDDVGRTAARISARTIRHELRGRFISLPRGELAAQLFRSVEQRVETMLGTSIAALDEHADGVRATLPDGESREFDLVIGADGLHSNVRALAFGPQHAFERPVGYYAAAFDVTGYRPRDELAYLGYGAPGRQITRFAQRDDRTMFLLVFDAGRLAEPVPHSLQARKETLRRVYAGVAWEWPKIAEALDAAEEIYFDRVSQIVMDSWSSGRIGLIGDAAASPSLLAGEGAGLAMTQAYVLAGELSRAGGDHRRALPAYEKRLHEFIARKQDAARSFAASFAPRTSLGLWLRNQAVKLMAIPGVPRLLIGAQLRDNLALPDYS
jgi:2-polyprenyl-6-methoxyphenol hydroxylase-like FAD-dependent oxidoreductase